ncbi:hypothetical protein FQN49_007435 [Arthroderma sp. PD_2]|nr:hypothetical protein FQN49_007435 [Arthroderma sp. PD_2]
MVLTPKPDSSYATTRLTTRNYARPHLLSNFNGSPAREASKRAAEEDHYSSDDSLKGTSRTSTKRKADPEIDAPPLSSSDEAGSENEIPANGGSPGRPQWSATYLDRAKEEANKAMEKEKAAKRRKSLPPKTQSRNAARKTRGRHSIGVRRPTLHPNGLGPANESEEPDWTSRVKKPKRKQACYGAGASGKTRQNIHGSAPLKPDAARQDKEPTIEPDDNPVRSSQASPSKGPEFKNPTSFMEAYTSIPASSSLEHEGDSLELRDEIDALSPLSSISSSLNVPNLPHVQEEIDHRKVAATLCPVCEVPVDVELLKSFRSIEKIGQQSRFCRLHRRKTAEEQWNERHYPTIDWESFQERIESHFAKLEDILSPENDSFYRKSLSSSTRDRKKQGNFRLTINSELEKMSAGYYGARGARTMMEAIIDRFAPKMRQLVLCDPLIQAVGVSGYVQAVLVPELTTMLVKEDMNVGDERARDIMKESMDIGDLVNEQLDDVVELEEGPEEDSEIHSKIDSKVDSEIEDSDDGFGG